MSEQEGRIYLDNGWFVRRFWADQRFYLDRWTIVSPDGRRRTFHPRTGALFFTALEAIAAVAAWRQSDLEEM